MQTFNFKECKLLITFFSIVICLYILKIPVPCLFHKITHLYCPGCGITRMFIALFQIDIAKAFSHNAFTFILLILFGGYVIFNFIYFKISKKSLKLPNSIIYILIIVGIIFAILRNLPAFSYLAP